MHPHDFKSIQDHLYEAYCTANDELIRLKRENKGLNDELNKIRNINCNLTYKLHTPPPTTALPVKVLKLAADWYTTGDNLLTLCAIIKLKFPAPITKAKISKSGNVAFLCNRKLFLKIKNETYVVEETLKELNPAFMVDDLSDISKAIFEFNNDDLIVFYKNSLICYRNTVRQWIFPIQSVSCITCFDNIIYVGTKDFKIYVISPDCINLEKKKVEPKDVIDVKPFVKDTLKDAFKRLIIKKDIFLMYSDNKVGCFNSGEVKMENFRIFSLDFDGSMLIYGGNNGSLQIGKIESDIEILDTLDFPKAILSAKIFNKFVLIGTQNKLVSVVDLENKKTMKIVLKDNVIDISCNDKQMCFVDNNGGLKVFEIM